MKNRFGSISGRAIKPIGLRVVAELRDAGIRLPIIATAGIRTFDDCREFFWAGADAVSLGSAVWLARMPLYALGPLEGIRIRRLIDRIDHFEPPPRVATAWAAHCDVPTAAPMTPEPAFAIAPDAQDGADTAPLAPSIPLGEPESVGATRTR